MSDQVYLARQPIFDQQREVYGYELLYRNEEGISGAENPRFATSTVLVNLLNQIGTQRCVGDKKAFVNIDSRILLTDIISSLPKEMFVFELSESMVVTNREIEAIAHLHRSGYVFGLDNVTLSETYYNNFIALFPYITFAKFDTTMIDIETLPSWIGRFAGFRLIAQKIEFAEIADAYEALGFEYYQGHFFAQPVLLQQTSLSPKHMSVIRLYNMLQNEEPLEHIAEEFQKHNELAMQLLQFIGSTSMLKVINTSSIRETLEQVGSRRLQLWLLLIIYSKSGHYIKHDKSDFSERIQKRIDIMLELVPKLGLTMNEAVNEQIRFLAFLSLIEDTFRMPLKSILKTVDVNESIENALLSKHGAFGHLLGLAEEIERSKFAAMRTYLKHYGRNIEDISDVIAKYQDI